jgi:hypothetical protein
MVYTINYFNSSLTFIKKLYLYIMGRELKKKKLIIERLNKRLLGEAEMDCPKPAVDLELNTKNRNNAINADHIKYGPLNVDEPGDYWEKLADHWDTTEEAAKKSLCGNCVAFDISQRMLDCMPGPVSDKGDFDEIAQNLFDSDYESLSSDEQAEVLANSDKLGYCWMHHFKCHSARTCYTWAKGGPITDDSVSYEWQEKNS